LQKKKDRSMPSQYSKTRIGLLVAMCVCALGAASCNDKTVKAANPAPVVPAAAVADSKPITNIAPDTNALPPVADATPPATNTPPTASASLPVTPARTKPAPPPPRKTTEPVTETASEQNTKPAVPVILPQLSAGDRDTYERETLADAQAAQTNLNQAQGRQLSAAQTDLVQKIQSFLKDSRAASQEGDWSRAQQLSQKARRVSEELIASF
jgi:hypothetical protein